MDDADRVRVRWQTKQSSVSLSESWRLQGMWRNVCFNCTQWPGKSQWRFSRTSLEEGPPALSAGQQFTRVQQPELPSSWPPPWPWPPWPWPISWPWPWPRSSRAASRAPLKPGRMTGLQGAHLPARCPCPWLWPWPMLPQKWWRGRSSSNSQAKSSSAPPPRCPSIRSGSPEGCCPATKLRAAGGSQGSGLSVRSWPRPGGSMSPSAMYTTRGEASTDGRSSAVSSKDAILAPRGLSSGPARSSAAVVLPPFFFSLPPAAQAAPALGAGSAQGSEAPTRATSSATLAGTCRPAPPSWAASARSSSSAGVSPASRRLCSPAAKRSKSWRRWPAASSACAASQRARLLMSRSNSLMEKRS
mmetsp:Transcript_34634/g.99516  ORF Transcript_34634/g.99516 Transcript_34634/m.99516 type:complete len:358 (-) Transcript_34634:1511-2584(-)